MELETVGYMLFFDCERCKTPSQTSKTNLIYANRTFCGSCGACYEFYTDVHGETQLMRVRFGEMYLPPIEWIELFAQGQDSGMAHETASRRNKSLWDRLWTFIYNE